MEIEAFNQSYYKVIHHGHLFSPTEEEEWTGVGIAGNIIMVVDRDEPVLRWGQERGAAFLDMKGRPLLPGFIDTHVHLLSTGIESLSPSIHGLSSVAAILDLIQGAVYRTPAGRPISFYSYNDLQIQEGRPPTRRELDGVAPHHPIFLSRIDLHSCVVNTEALQRLGFHPTGSGLFWGVEGYRLRRKFLSLYSRGEKTRAIKEAAFRASQAGVTSLHAMEGGDWQGDDAIDIALDVQEELPLHMVLYPMTLDLDTILSRNLHTLGGDLFLDGSLGSKTAALTRAYCDEPGNRGHLYYETKHLTRVVEKALDRGMMVGFHVIGDAAIEQALQVFEEASSCREVPPFSFRLEHFSLPDPGHIRRARDLGVGIGIQAFSPKSYPQMEDRLGKERSASLYPHRAMFEAGLLLAAGSDSNVEGIHPLGILARLQKRSFSYEEALTLCTWNGAQLVGEGGIRGRIQPGMVADLVVVNKNPALLPPEEQEWLQVLLTMGKGRIEFLADSF